VAGIQRERVMAWSHQHGMALQVRNIRLEEALLADELFIVNSVFGLWPIRQFGTANELGLCHWNHFPLATKIRLDLF
jgi:4-amino-4-deoxychorismate lyase